MSASWPHYLWLALWGALLGSGISLLIIYEKIKTILNALSIFFYIFISLEYLLMFSALKIG